MVSWRPSFKELLNLRLKIQSFSPLRLCRDQVHPCTISGGRDGFALPDGDFDSGLSSSAPPSTRSSVSACFGTHNGGRDAFGTRWSRTHVDQDHGVTVSVL
jgi:hypothetical protein